MQALTTTQNTAFLTNTTRLYPGSDESWEVFVGDVTSHQLHNLKPGTTYDLKVLAQYNTGFSEPLIGQGTTCKLKLIRTFSSAHDSSWVVVVRSCMCFPRGICTNLCLLPFSVPQCDRPEHLQRRLRHFLCSMGASQSSYLLQSQSQSFWP